ncbi:hypothetical protein [Phyllobacterium zundukense]|uniref:Uncharacterized protein n=1 Tax=Phyllobacterium zundukense TaxID=1867719 RepID=A0A2N9W4U1_9HYPH|nr:hypothetical protein [Phyllobacterium zundukense]ATU91775.1 hypothetical protein BLM14_09185 [Phyllobacterium zundukense]PIO46759.1 hypothetical protein B5P45_02890 [Phyllobacterium zundukense]
MTENFKYSDEMRARLAATLGRSSEHREVSHVERIVTEWVSHNEKHIQADLARNARIATAAENLLLELDLDRDENDDDRERDFAEDGDPVTLRGHLLVAIDFLDFVKKEHENLIPKGRPSVLPRLLSTRLLEFWDNSGRRIARSSTTTKDAPDIQTPSGPLVRFLIAATEPVLQHKVPLGAAEHAIRLFYPRRRNEDDEKSTEFFRTLMTELHGESTAKK